MNEAFRNMEGNVHGLESLSPLCGRTLCIPNFLEIFTKNISWYIRNTIYLHCVKAQILLTKKEKYYGLRNW